MGLFKLLIIDILNNFRYSPLNVPYIKSHLEDEMKFRVYVGFISMLIMIFTSIYFNLSEYRYLIGPRTDGMSAFFIWLLLSLYVKMAMTRGFKNPIISVISILIWLKAGFNYDSSLHQKEIFEIIPLSLKIPTYLLVLGWPIVDFIDLMIPFPYIKAGKYPEIHSYNIHTRN